jgi:hypothetical protein
MTNFDDKPTLVERIICCVYHAPMTLLLVSIVAIVVMLLMRWAT